MNEQPSNHPGIDYHIHTNASLDGVGVVEEYCAAAQAGGFRELGFTNHLDLDPGHIRGDIYDHAAFVTELKSARANSPDLNLRIGTEVTYQPEFEKETADYLNDIEADFVMGSVHIIGASENCISEEEGSRHYFGSKTCAEEAYTPYFEQLYEAVRFGYFDVIGHFDAVKRYGKSMLTPLEYNNFYGIIKQILEGIIKRDMAIEVNASGLFHLVEEIYPTLEILKLYRELGGQRLTIGSDAHTPGDLGKGLDQALTLIRHAGFSELTLYENRNPKQARLP